MNTFCLIAYSLSTVIHQVDLVSLKMNTMRTNSTFTILDSYCSHKNRSLSVIVKERETWTGNKRHLDIKYLLRLNNMALI